MSVRANLWYNQPREKSLNITGGETVEISEQYYIMGVSGLSIDLHDAERRELLGTGLMNKIFQPRNQPWKVLELRYPLGVVVS